MLYQSIDEWNFQNTLKVIIKLQKYFKFGHEYFGDFTSSIEFGWDGWHCKLVKYGNSKLILFKIQG